MLPNPQKTADLVTFTEEILYGKLHFFPVAMKPPYNVSWRCKVMLKILTQFFNSTNIGDGWI